jgi:hypothetical protein
LLPETTLSGARMKIAAVRQKLQMVVPIAGLADQVTPDLLARIIHDGGIFERRM